VNYSFKICSTLQVHFIIKQAFLFTRVISYKHIHVSFKYHDAQTHTANLFIKFCKQLLEGEFYVIPIIIVFLTDCGWDETTANHTNIHRKFL